MHTKTVLIPLPSYGFDPTEVAIPWQTISEGGFEIVFATPQGKQAAADSIMLTGKKLGIWAPLLRARKDAVAAYCAMEKSQAFSQPLKYSDVNPAEFDAILLPGGHDKGVREYLESGVLQRHLVDFFSASKPVGAICHGVVLAARSIDSTSGKSVIHRYKTTSLLKSQERLAYQLSRLWLQDYYLTYPQTTVEDEVRSALCDGDNFIEGSPPLLRDSISHLERGFVVRDRNYLSARWPGDAYTFSLEFVRMLHEKNV